VSGGDRSLTVGVRSPNDLTGHARILSAPNETAQPAGRQQVNSLAPVGQVVFVERRCEDAPAAAGTAVCLMLRPLADPIDDRRLRRIRVAIALGLFAVNLDFFGVQTALPAMAGDLGTTPTNLQWVISGYLLALASVFIVGGRLADVFGRRRFLLVGAVLFGLTSLVGGAASVAWLVILMRVVQGVGGALLFPVGLAVVTNAYPPERVQRAILTVFGIAAVGQALGPLVGGVITGALSWRWVLWLNVPIALIVIVLVLRDVAESRDATASRRIDWLGLCLVSASVGLFVYGIDGTGSWGWVDARTALFVGGGIVGFVALIAVERRVAEPLLDLALFRIRAFTLMVATGATGNFAALATIFLVTTLLQDVRGMSPTQAGLAFLSFSVPFAAGNQLTKYLGRFEAWAVMSAVLAVAGLGTALMGLTGGRGLFFAASVLSGLGLGAAWAYANAVSQAVVPPTEAGVASGIVLTVLVSLGGVGVAVASSVIEPRETSMTSYEHAIEVALVGFGLAVIVVAALTAAFGRRVLAGGTPRLSDT
jgi:EmrB/QacA subfamily drug resistance transporter